MAPCRGHPAVPGELNEVESVQERDGAGEVDGEDDTRLERGDEQRLAPRVVARYLRTELGNARGDLLAREVDLADPLVGRYASSRRNRCARRSTSRL
jgi:hypothetical protein